MKGLLITLLVVCSVIVLGVGASILVHVSLNDSVVRAENTGSDEGYQAGYEDGLVAGGIAGYQEGSKAGYMNSNPQAAADNISSFYFIYNPAYSEVQDILAGDGLHDVQAFIDYAAVHAIRIAYVRCQTVPSGPDDWVRLVELVGFDTVDNDFIIIDPASHKEVTVEKGKSFSALNGLPAVDYDDTIDKITICW